jgi:beta-arrestin
MFQADIVQHVDVCMFSNGKFKNVVAQICSREGCPVEPGLSLSRSFILKPEKGTTKNWIALEDDPGYARASANLASTVVSSSNSPEDRNVFAIYVSYYVKVPINRLPSYTTLFHLLANVKSIRRYSVSDNRNL